MLRRLLTRRFGELPDWVEERLAQASRQELEVWAERVLEAQQLAEVFAAAERPSTRRAGRRKQS